MKLLAAVVTALSFLAGIAAAPIPIGKHAPFSGIATFFAPGHGSCGGVDNENSMIVRSPAGLVYYFPRFEIAEQTWGFFYLFNRLDARSL
jgi:hypothetical protein